MKIYTVTKKEYFYEIVKIKGGRNDGTIQLFGPFDNIYRVNPAPGKESKWAFAQLVDGMPKQTFTEEEILVTDRIL